MIELWLPYPPSVNHTYIRRGSKVFKSPKAQAFFDEVGLLAANLEPLTGELVLSVDFYRPQKSGDVDNRIKALQDSLQGLAYHDDKQIVELHIRRLDDRKNHPKGAARVTIAAIAENAKQRHSVNREGYRVRQAGIFRVREYHVVQSMSRR